MRLRYEKEGLVEELSSSNAELHRTNRMLRDAKEDLRIIALTDELTGLSNRRHFIQLFKRHWARAHRSHQPVSCLMIDIDHFKAYNDHYGHQQGDECLKAVAGIMKKTIQRPDDLVARYGGEEFVAVLPDTGLSGAVLVAERMIDALRGANIEHLGAPEGQVTVSVGVAAFRDVMDHGMDELLKAADDALYRAKEQGRNRLTVENASMAL